MAFHPRENWDPRTRRRLYSRREFLWRAGAVGASLPVMSALLAACGDGGEDAVAEVVIGTPSNPATQPLSDSNPMIESGMAAEAGPLKIYNWADYLNPDTIEEAKAALGVDIELTTYFNEEEALQKLISGEVNFDVWFPVASTVGKSVAGQLIQPINHDYIPNLANVWPQLADPFYDKGSQYSVPYTVYQTGIAWREDMVDSADVDIDNPYDVFWNPKYKGITGLYDDFRETLHMVMHRQGVGNTPDATQAQVDAAADALLELVDLMDIRYSIDGAYAGIPEGKYGLHMSWSGDIVAAPYYFPEDGDPSVTRYLWPAHGKGTVRANIANDTIAVLKGAESPVLAHQFLNFMLDETNAVNNFGWVGYQPPQNGLDVDSLVADEWVPEYLSSAIVLPEDFDNDRGEVPIQLNAEQEKMLLDAWARVQAGG
ncbi:MAG: extracellular solute-binding protein [Acidimicrobiia bacterium]|nr:extracellular solute-binding protein [Acidimicrobiia bacterium]